ncbi:hypothetical protein AYI69_g7188 [Smittium culicis]|uniref:Uncharacterized protein n=1 Tax=Smittium culicis TaxID=133412 RepID=A0A1R1XTP9_9FUNG|nr:hypothetical protein AYI69_g7188 [Smittium culicis]
MFSQPSGDSNIEIKTEFEENDISSSDSDEFFDTHCDPDDTSTFEEIHEDFDKESDPNIENTHKVDYHHNFTDPILFPGSNLNIENLENDKIPSSTKNSLLDFARS